MVTSEQFFANFKLGELLNFTDPKPFNGSVKIMYFQ